MGKTYKEDNCVKQNKLQTLRGELERMRTKEAERVVEYVSHVKTLMNQLRRNGEKLLTCWVVEQTLRSLTSNFEKIVCAIEEFKDLSMVSMEELVKSLEAHDQWRRKKKEDSLDQTFQVKATIKEKKTPYTQNTQGRVIES